MRGFTSLAAAVMLAFVLAIAAFPAKAHADAEIVDITPEDAAKLTSQQVGIGGGGALFAPAISPHNANEMCIKPDMGGVYVSHDQGLNWSRANLDGTVRCVRYDPTTPGVIYAGGSGLWRSEDWGDTFEMIFPDPSTLKARCTFNENVMYFLMPSDSVYDRFRYIKDVLVDPDDMNHVLALGYYGRIGVLYESTDRGATFVRLFEYEKTVAGNIEFELNKILLQRETGDIFVVNDDGAMLYDRAAGASVRVNDCAYADVETVFQDGHTTFLTVEKVTGRADTESIVRKTTDLSKPDDPTVTEDLTDIFMNAHVRTGETTVEPTSGSLNTFTYKDVEYTYKFRFRYVSAVTLDDIYVAHFTQDVTNGSNKYPYPVDGIFRYRPSVSPVAEFIFGNPVHNQVNLPERSWSDGNTYSLGICASVQDPGALLYTTLTGVFYAPDEYWNKGRAIYPRYSTLVNDENGESYTTNGIDEQTTYGVVQDPFDENIQLLLNTDLGMIRSVNGGKSWNRTLKNIPGEWQNTSYDAAFDKRREGVVYSLWCGRHDAPYDPGHEAVGRAGGFAVSTDHGATWMPMRTCGIPANSVPMKMAVTYPEGSAEAVIYAATFNNGFYVSYDSGNTFTELNDGIGRVEYTNGGVTYSVILGTYVLVDGDDVYAMTGLSSYNKETQKGEVFKLVDGAWEKLPLPAGMERPRIMAVHGGKLYVGGVATAKWISGKEIENHDGGVYVYDGTAFSQVFDETLSVNGIAFDSRGTMFVADIEGNIYRKEAPSAARAANPFVKIYSRYHFISKYLQVTNDGDTLYLSALGGGVLKLSGLNGLYADDAPVHVHSGGVATCSSAAVCEGCGLSYGSPDPAVHTYGEGIVTRQPTKDAEGLCTFTCLDCGGVRTEAIPKLTDAGDDGAGGDGGAGAGGSGAGGSGDDGNGNGYVGGSGGSDGSGSGNQNGGGSSAGGNAGDNGNGVDSGDNGSQGTPADKVNATGTDALDKTSSVGSPGNSGKWLDAGDGLNGTGSGLGSLDYAGSVGYSGGFGTSETDPYIHLSSTGGSGGSANAATPNGTSVSTTPSGTGGTTVVSNSTQGTSLAKTGDPGMALSLTLLAIGVLSAIAELASFFALRRRAK